MKRSGLLVVVVSLGACTAQPHVFVVDVSRAEKPVDEAAVIFCHSQPQPLERADRFFQGTVIARCKRSGKLRLSHSDGTKTDCPIGRVVAKDQWLGFELQGRTCISKWFESS